MAFSASLLVICVVLVLSIDRIGVAAARALVPGYLPWKGATVSIGSTVIGLRRVRVIDLRVQLDSGNSVAIDTADIHLVPLSITSRIASLRLHGVRLVASATDSTWAWLAPFANDTAAPTEPYAFRIDTVTVERGAFAASTAAGLLVAADSLDADLNAITFGTQVGIRIASVSFRLRHRRSGTHSLGVQSAARLADDVWTIDSLQVTDTEGGALRADGRIPSADAKNDEVAVRIRGQRFRIASLDASRDGVIAPDQRADIDAIVRGSLAHLSTEGHLLFQDAGGLQWSGDLNRRAATPILTARVTGDRLGVARVIGIDSTLGAITGTVDTRLAMTGVDSLDGPVNIDIGATVAGEPVRLGGRADFDRGEATLALRTVVRGKAVQIGGQLRPFDAVPRYHLDLRSALELPVSDAVAAREPALRQPVTIRATFAGQGFSTDVLRARAEAHIAPTTPTPRIGELHLRATIEDAVALVRADAALGGGMVDAVGSVSLTDSLNRWVVQGVRVRGVDIAPWLGDTAVARLDARLSARAIGPRIVATALIDSVRGGRLTELTGQVEFAMAGDRTRAAADVRQGDATVRVDSLILSAGDVVGGTGTFARIDPAAYAAGAPHGALSGRIIVEPLAADPSPEHRTSEAGDGVRLAARIALDSTSALGVNTLGGNARVILAGGAIAIDADVAGEGQALSIVGATVRPDSILGLSVDRLTFRNLDPAMWSEGRLPTGRFTGSVRGAATGTDPVTAVADVRLTLDSSLVGGVVVDGLTTTLALRERVARLDSHGYAGDLSVDVGATATLQRDGAWAGDATTTISRAGPADSTNAIRARAEFSGPDSAGRGAWRTRVDARGTLDRFRLDSLRAAVALEQDAITVEALTLDGSGIAIHGNGRVPVGRSARTNGDLTVAGALTDLGPLAALAGFPDLHGHGTVNIRSVGPVDDVRHAVEIQLASLRSPWVELDSVAVQLRGRSDSTTALASATASVTATGRRSLLVSVGNETFVGLGSSGAFGESGAGSLLAVGSWNAIDPRAITIDTVRARVDDQIWALERPVPVHWGDTLVVGDLALVSSVGRVTAGGRIARSGDEAFSMAVHGLPVEVRRADTQRTLAGRLDVEGQLTGVASSPLLRITGRITPAPDVGLHEVILEADWNARGLRMRLAESGDSSRFGVEGTLPVRLSLADSATADAADDDAVDLRARVRDLDVAVLTPILIADTTSRISGRLNADVHITGATHNPQLQGNVGIDRFGFRAPAYGTDLSADRIAIALAGQRATLDSVTVRSGRRGTLRLAGTVDFPELASGRIDLDATLDRFAPARGRDVAATISGNLAIGGTTNAPAVTGSLQVVDANYQMPSTDLPAGLEEIELTDADYREIEERFGIVRSRDAPRGSALDAATFDVAVDAQSDVWVRRSFGPAMAVELGGNVRVRKAPNAEWTFDGRLAVVEGRSFIEEYGRRFEVASGTATLDGPAGSAQFSAEGRFRPTDDVTITLTIKGSPDSLSLVLGSEPSMDENDIISYIAVGRPADEGFRAGAVKGDAAALGASVGLSRVGSSLQDVARESLGLDVVEIRQDGIKGLTLAAGRYVSRRLYLGFQQGIGFRTGQGSTSALDATEVDIEYRVASWLLTNLSASRSLARFFFRSRHAY